MSRKSKSSKQSETDLMLHMFADPTKLKPIVKTINVSHIDEDETALENGIRRPSNDDISFEGSESKSIKSSSSTSSSTSSMSSSSSSSSTSSNSNSRRRVDKISDNKSHNKLNKIVDNYNSKASSSSNSSGSSSSSTSSSSSSSSDSDSSKSSKSKKETKEEQQEEKPETKKAPIHIPKWTNEREKKVYKMGLYYELQDYAKRRKLTRDYPPSSSIEDMEDEVKIQQKIDEKEEAIVIGKEGMKQFSTLIVRGNKMWDPFGLKLDGWDNQIANNINNYDVVLSRLHDKYAHYISRIEPEYVFLWMFVGSAVTFHYAKKYVEENGLEELVKQNPELLAKIQNTIASTLESKASAQLEPKKIEQRRTGLSQAETYRKYKEEQKLNGNGPIPEGDEINDDDVERNVSPNVNSTINAMLVNNTAFLKPKPSLGLGMGSQRVNAIMATTNHQHTIPLSETSRLKVETVDSESVENHRSQSQSINRPRLKITRK